MSSNTSDYLETELSLGIRERIMDYFKGTCVDRMYEYMDIHVRAFETSMRGIPNNRRVEISRENKSLLSVGSIPVLIMKRSPDKIIILSSPGGMSRKLQRITGMVISAVHQFLPGVEISRMGGAVYGDADC